MQAGKQMPFLLIFVGIPSSGKSTLARKLASLIEARMGTPTMVVSSDGIRDMMPVYEEKFVHEREEIAQQGAVSLIALGLKKRYFVISDDLNYYVSVRKDLSQIARSNGVGFATLYVSTPLATALEWNRKRGEPVPESLIEDVWNKMDKPGEKYGWDKPICQLDPSIEDPSKAVEKAYDRILVALERWGKPSAPEPVRTEMSKVEKTTRQELSEILRRYRSAELPPELAKIRKQVVVEALRLNLGLAEAQALFAQKAAEVISTSASLNVAGKVPVHVGLFGHVDHGKTSLARCLAEKASTAAHDKHPEAQRRGMTIDLGFSTLTMGGYVVTLVDMPGHFSLISQVVAGANIIDLALLVIAADKGVEVQTLEHLAIIRSLKIGRIIVVLNKSDLVTPETLSGLDKALRKDLAKSDLKWEVVAASATKGTGIQELKDAILQLLAPPLRNWGGSLKMPIDHSFPIAGVGTVLTGTVVRGKVGVGDEVEVVPRSLRGRVKFIQMFSSERESAAAGDRVGIAVRDLRSADVGRGDVLCTPNTVKPCRHIVAEVNVEKSYKYPLDLRSLVHVGIGLSLTQAKIFPFKRRDGFNVIMPRLETQNSLPAYFELTHPVACEAGDNILLIKLDLHPKAFRIVGSGIVKETPDSPPEFSKAKERVGIIVSQLGNGRGIVKGFFSSADGAEHYVGQDLKVSDGGSLRIIRAEGQDGSVLAELDDRYRNGETLTVFSHRPLAAPRRSDR